MNLEWKGTPVAVRELGQGPPVVLVHGYPLDGAMWSGVARALSTRFRVFKPDLPGRGENPTPPAGSIDDYADFIGAILGHLPGPAGLAGFSMGGYVAFGLLRGGAPNVGALALLDTRAVADDDAGRAARETSIAAVRSGGAAAIVDGMISKLLAPASQQNASLVERLRRMVLRQKPETLESDLTAMRDRPDATGLLARIAAPTLVLAGVEDAITPAAQCEAMAAAIPGARYVPIPAAGHLTPMERPGAVAAALSGFFAENLAGGAPVANG
jgi:pimeloyl-ACP methyl ester carboxylesterase